MRKQMKIMIGAFQKTEGVGTKLTMKVTGDIASASDSTAITIDKKRWFRPFVQAFF